MTYSALVHPRVCSMQLLGTFPDIIDVDLLVV